MSIEKDFRKRIAEIKRRTDISKAEVARLMDQAYKEAKKELGRELRTISVGLAHVAAQAKARDAINKYTDDMTEMVDRAANATMHRVSRQTAEAHIAAEHEMLASVGAKRTPQIRIIASNKINSVVARSVEKLLIGTVYPDGLPISHRILRNRQAIRRDIHTLITNGIYQGKGIDDIVSQILRYVDPKGDRDWNKLVEDGFSMHRRNVAYNSHRLVRTLSQHAYQSAIEASAMDNPFITGFRWLANGSDPCPICIARNGRVFDKGRAPLDHPNGECVLIPVIDDSGIDARLVSWANGRADRELSTWARNLGYEA